VKCRGRSALCRGVELSKAVFSKDIFGKNYFLADNRADFLQVVNGKAGDGAERHMVIRHKSYGMSKTDTVMDRRAVPPLKLPRSPRP